MMEEAELDLADIINMGLLSRDPGFKIVAQGVGKGLTVLVDWVKQGPKWPTMRKLETLDLPCLNVEEGIQTLMKFGMRICQISGFFS